MHMQVCEEAGVKLEVVPLTDQYWQRVVSHCLAEIKAGRTPNPDVLCNSRQVPLSCHSTSSMNMLSQLKLMWEPCLRVL